MKTYLTNLLKEKGKNTEDYIDLDEQFEVTWEMLIDFISTVPEHHETIKNTLAMIDSENGDILHYLIGLAEYMTREGY